VALFRADKRQRATRRALLLSSLNATLVKAATLLADYTQCKNAVLDAKEIELFKSFTKESQLIEITAELRGTLGEVEEVTGRASVDLYDRVVARATHLSTRIDDISADMSAAKTMILQKLREDSEGNENI
jgi:hypothetical protein